MSVPIAAALVAGAVLLGVPVLVASGVTVAGARAANAADAAALAAADALLGIAVSAEEPCGLAAEISSLHGGTVTGCNVDETLLEARVTVAIRSGLITVTREARAGPPSG